MSELEAKTQNLLRQSEQALESDVARQLKQVRQRALSKKQKESRLPSFLIPATGMALASLVALVLVYSPTGSIYNNDNEVLANENIELYEELDFYYWLASQESHIKS